MNRHTVSTGSGNVSSAARLAQLASLPPARAVHAETSSALCVGDTFQLVVGAAEASHTCKCHIYHVSMQGTVSLLFPNSLDMENQLLPAAELRVPAGEFMSLPKEQPDPPATAFRYLSIDDEDGLGEEVFVVVSFTASPPTEQSTMQPKDAEAMLAALRDQPGQTMCVRMVKIMSRYRHDATPSSLKSPAQVLPKPHQTRPKSPSEPPPYSSSAAASSSATSSSSSSTTDGGHDVFVSFRFGEAHQEALALKAALEALGLRVFLSDVSPGDNLQRTIARALQKCRLVAVLATKDVATQWHGVLPARAVRSLLVRG